MTKLRNIIRNLFEVNIGKSRHLPWEIFGKFK
jgi:hypothetical protein